MHYSESIANYYQSIAGQRFYSPTGEIIKNCLNKEIGFSDLIEADLLLFYSGYSIIVAQKTFFPILGCYSNFSAFSFLSKLVYKDGLKHLMKLFDASDKEDLKKKILIPKKYDDYIRGYRTRLPNVTDIVDYELWGTLI
jgi:hypothetical protein